MDDDQVRLQRKTIRLVLEQCQRTLELLKNADDVQDQAEAGDGIEEVDDSSTEAQSPSDCEADELCELLKSKVESQDFLEKLGSIHMSVSQNTARSFFVAAEDCTSWDVISSKDLWENEDDNVEQDGYVHVNKEDIVESIACFMAAYLLSLKETKDLTPDQLQQALTKTFATKGKKSKLRKAWDGSIVIYNVTSWGATALGMYQNPAIFKAATGALLSSCRIISKLF